MFAIRSLGTKLATVIKFSHSLALLMKVWQWPNLILRFQNALRLADSWPACLTNHYSTLAMKNFKWKRQVEQSKKGGVARNWNLSKFFKFIVARIAKEQIEPHVRLMDEKAEMLPEIREILFKNGVSVHWYLTDFCRFKQSNSHPSFSCCLYWQRFLTFAPNLALRNRNTCWIRGYRS